MGPVNATAASRAELIILHDYLHTMGNLKAVEGSTVAGLSNKGRESRLSSVACRNCIEAHSTTLAQSGRPRWTHNHRRFANLSVFPSKSSSTSQILLNYITGSSSSTSRRHRRSSSTSRLSRGVLNMRHSPQRTLHGEILGETSFREARAERGPVRTVNSTDVPPARADSNDRTKVHTSS